MLRLPQAHSLVLGQLFRLFAPAAVTVATLSFIGREAQIQFPTWLFVAVATVSIPTYHIGHAKVQYWRLARKAARLGATMPPRWDGKMIGNWDVLKLLDDAFYNGYLSDHLGEKFDQFGLTYNLCVLWANDYCTADPSIIKSVLATDFSNWVKGEQTDEWMHSVMGIGVFNADGDLWKFHRSMTRPFFSRDRISDFDTFDKHAEEAISTMKHRLREGYAVDFQDLISRFTLDSATEFLFGSCVHSLHSVLPYPHHAPARLKNTPLSPADEFAEAFRDAQAAIAHRARVTWLWPWYELLGSNTVKQMKVVDGYLEPILKQAVEKTKGHEKVGGTAGGEIGEVGEGDTLLDHLARHTTDPTILHDEVLNIMIAGRDTTAGMLTIAIYFLTQHPEVLHRLRNEILDVVGPSNRPSYDGIRGMKYLRAVINETLRLYPAVPWNKRYAVEDTILPNSDPAGKPWFVPTGTPVSYSVHCMHRRKELWGPDAEEFDPDRFLDERLHKYLTPNPFIFLPFNAGPRICLGQQFAYNEMSFFLVRLLQSFDSITLDTGSQDPASRPPEDWTKFQGRKGKEKFWPKSHLTLYSAGGIWVKMHEAGINSSDA